MYEAQVASQRARERRATLVTMADQRRWRLAIRRHDQEG
jgi:hypothetical protein